MLRLWSSIALLGAVGNSALARSAAVIPPERLGCSVYAAQIYGLPANVMLAVAEQEGGRPGIAVRNTNGTFDLGSMQLNSSYIATLRGYGIRPEHVTARGCYPYLLAAWRIRRHVQFDRGDFWSRVANYHSYTPVHNALYRRQIIERAARWDAWLKLRQAALRN